MPHSNLNLINPLLEIPGREGIIMPGIKKSTVCGILRMVVHSIGTDNIQEEVDCDDDRSGYQNLSNRSSLNYGFQWEQRNLILKLLQFREDPCDTSRDALV